MTDVLLSGGPADLNGDTISVPDWPRATLTVTAADASNHLYRVDEADTVEPYAAAWFDEVTLAPDDNDVDTTSRKGAGGERGLSGAQGPPGTAGTHAVRKRVIIGGTGFPWNVGGWQADGWQGGNQRGRSLGFYEYRNLVAGALPEWSWADATTGPSRVIIRGCGLYSPSGLAAAGDPTPDRMQANGTLMLSGLPVPAADVYLHGILRFVYAFSQIEQWEIGGVKINTVGEMRCWHRTTNPNEIPNDAQGKQWTKVFLYGLDGRGYSTG